MDSFITAICIAILCVIACAPARAQTTSRQAVAGRIDIYVAHQAFDLSQARGSSGAAVGRCPWLGEGNELTGVSCQKSLGKEWEHIWVEFVPEKDGEVDIDLQGEWYEKQGEEDIRLVWVDNVTVEGAAIRNGDFEEAGEDGPVGWHFTGRFPPARYSRDGSVAQSGRACVAVWYGSQARQTFAVRAGRRYRVGASFRVLDPDRVHGPATLKSEYPMETYGQELRVVFATPEAARKAFVEVEPLYNGHAWAVSCRWDDNNVEDLHMRDVMAAHGHRGTFYLNAPRRGFGREIGVQLLEGGNSIGGHSMSHPFLTLVSRNRQFWEVLAVRMQWEAATDHPICSYSFSFCDFRSGPEANAVHRDIAQALGRAGYYHVANGWFNRTLRTDLELSPILPSDGAPIDDAAAGFLADENHRRDHPHMSYSMHVWYRTPEAWARFADHLDAYGHRPDWWYCNQSEYAAYRWQYRRATLRETQRSGKELTLRIDRPVLRELNDPVPLTLAIRGVDADTVAGAECDTADVELARPTNGAALVNVHHDRTRRLPAAIGLIENEDNHGELSKGDVASDFPQVGGLLHFRNGRLELLLDNRGDDALEDVTVIYRLPPAWKEGVVRRRMPAVNGRFQDSVTPTLQKADYKYRSGTSFYGAQVDFTRAGQAGRLHLSCRVPNPRRDPSYPQGGFLVFGPIPEEDFSASDVEASVRAGTVLTNPPVLPGGRGLRWQPEDPSALELLDVEVVATSGIWHNRDETRRYYLLYSVLHSDAAQRAGLLYGGPFVEAIYLNGERAEGRDVDLRPGENEFLIVAVLDGSRFRAANAGCFLRLTSPGTGDRLTNIRFERE